MSSATLSLAALDRPEDIARIHVAAIGGEGAIRALSSLRVTGQVATPTRRVDFVLVAARPNRLRMETRFDDRVVVQGWDGAAPPWQFDAGKTPASAAPMSDAAAERFVMDADFDDPLVRWQERGYRLEFAGRTQLGAGMFLRVLVARSVTENVVLLLDPTTYFIAMRVQHLTKGGDTVELVTRYDDFRPVQGVLLPHDMTLFADGEFSQRVKFERVEANPKLSPEFFAQPGGSPFNKADAPSPALSILPRTAPSAPRE